MRFKDKIVLISGGNRGIGLAAARLFAEEGASLSLAARNPETGKAIAKELGALFVKTDVRQADNCENAVTQTLQAYGKLDVLVNNAGVLYRNMTIEQTSEEIWDITFDTNVKGMFFLSKYAMPALRATQGAIVNLSSYAGLVGFAGVGAYAAAKAAVINLTRSMALDHAKENIRVNCVCPGSVETDMIYEAWHLYGDVEKARKLWESKHPMGRIATPEEVARAILFLASSDASFITGVALPVDGGITAA